MSTQPTLRRLTIFDAVIRAGSAGTAAQAIGLSQPAVTHALHKLEAEAGARLLDRGPGGSQPTRAGRLLHRRVERLLRQIELGMLDMGSEAAPRSLTTPQLRAHLAIARRGSFRAAARDLGVAEPSLHRVARDLETAVGVKLYRRTPQGVSATRDGLRFAGRLRLALYEIDQALDELEAERELGRGRVSVGCLPLMPKPVIARALGRLLQDFPAVQVTVEEAPHVTLMASLRAAELDILVGALRTPRLGGDVRERPLFSDPHLVAVRRDHPLARADEVEEADLSRFPWVVPPCGTPRGAYVERLFAELPERPRIVAETSSLSMMTALLAESDCLTLVSRAQALQEFRGVDLATLPLHLRAPERTVGATTRAGWLPTIVQRRFLDLLRQECRRIAEEPLAA